MERIKAIKETLMSCAEGQMTNLQNVDAKELGEVIDMIKDLEEAIYYCTITKAMEEKEKNGEQYHYYTPVNYNYYTERDMDREQYGRMYYTQPRDSQGRFTEDGRKHYGSSGNGNGSGQSSSNQGGNSYYTEPMMYYRDRNEGRSPEYRRTYMESKHTNKDTAKKMHELEKYAQELTSDIIEMIEGATPEEKQYLAKKINVLSGKIENV